MIVSEEKLLEIAQLSEIIIKTDESRFGNHMLKSRNDVFNNILEEMESPTLARAKLERLINSLNPEQLCHVQALMWLGRSSFENSDEIPANSSYEDLYLYAKETANKYDASYVLQKKKDLSRYLKRGMIAYNSAT